MPCSNGLFFRKIIRIHFGNDVCSNGFFINIFGAIEPILEEKSLFYTHTLTNVGLLLLKTAWSSLVKYGYEQFFFYGKRIPIYGKQKNGFCIWFLSLAHHILKPSLWQSAWTLKIPACNDNVGFYFDFIRNFMCARRLRQHSCSLSLIVCVCVSRFSLDSIFHLIFTHSIFPILSLSIGELSRSRIGWIFPAMSDSYRASLFRS